MHHMKTRIISLLWGITLTAALWAGNIERVSATYEYISNNPNETPAQAKATAFERARQKALEEKFGLDVSQVTSSTITNANGSSYSNVFSLGGTSVRGEWVETIKEEVLEEKLLNGFMMVKVSVVGKARNRSTEKTDIRFAFVRDIRDTESPVSFKDGNDIFMRFSSPAGGSLCVYLVDEQQNAFCLLPYPDQQAGAQPVEANKEYIFFSEQFDRNAQEYTVNCERTSEQNALYVVFSPNRFTKASDKQSGTNWRNEKMPRQLTHEAFLKWLERNQTKDDQMVVRREIISIRKD